MCLSAWSDYTINKYDSYADSDYFKYIYNRQWNPF